MDSNTNKPLFTDLSAEDDDQETSQLESVCLSCGENGVTNFLLTKIPHFHEIVLIAFNCSHCGYKNNETQFGGKIQEKGVKIELTVQNESDLNRQVVKSDYASISIPEVDLEIKAESHRGELTTVEGVINRVIEGLQQNQTTRKEENPELALKIDNFIDRISKLKLLETPFHLIVDDPSGNSFIENPLAPKQDKFLVTTKYSRSDEQVTKMGFMPEQREVEDNVPEEVALFHTNCSECGSLCETKMKPTEIPHFKEVVIMATDCSACGHRSNEVKSGSGIESKGTRIELHITNIRDLHRDVLKSDTCSTSVPELELEVGAGALGGRFTTVEGLFDSMAEQLQHPFGDSSQPERKERMFQFIEKLKKVQSGDLKVHLILDDPAGNSYVEKISENDELLTITQYERTFEQNEELGLNDMNTENY